MMAKVLQQRTPRPYHEVVVVDHELVVVDLGLVVVAS